MLVRGDTYESIHTEIEFKYQATENAIKIIIDNGGYGLIDLHQKFNFFGQSICIHAINQSCMLQ